MDADVFQAVSSPLELLCSFIYRRWLISSINPLFFLAASSSTSRTNTRDKPALTALLIRGRINAASPRAFPRHQPLITVTARYTRVLLHSVAGLLFSCVGEGCRLRDTIECLWFYTSFKVDKTAIHTGR